MNAPNKPAGFLVNVADGFRNIFSRIGGANPTSIADTFALAMPTDYEIEAAYRTGWLRKIVDIPPFDMTREWRAWQADDADIEAIEAEENRLQLPVKIMEAMSLGRLWGGAGLFLGVDGDPASELLPDSIGKGGLQFIHVFPRQALRIERLILDPRSPYYGEPESYQMQSDGADIAIHPSRVIRFFGNKVPSGSLDQAGRMGWGDSIMAAIRDELLQASKSSAAVADLLHQAKFDIIKIPDLMSAIATDEFSGRLVTRLELVAKMKSLANTTILDKEEEWETKQINFTNLPDVIKTFFSILAGAADIPATRLLGKAPDGMNSTGESDMRNYYDMVASRQELELRPALEHRIDPLLVRSALGAQSPDIFFVFNPLWQTTDAEEADIAKKKAEVAEIDSRIGLVPATALAKGRQNQLVEDNWYPGIEAALAEAEAAQDVPPITEQLSPQEQAQLEIEKAKAIQPPVAANSNQRPTARGKRTADMLMDAQPRSLFVYRRLLNTDQFRAWAKAQGFKSTVPAAELHVTLIYSKAPIDWMKVSDDGWSGDDRGRLLVREGGPRIVEPLGPKGAIVLLFNSTPLQWRYADIIRAGAQSDYEEYVPHVTITYDLGDVDLTQVEPYQGPLLFGPETFEEIDSGYSAGVEEIDL